MTSEPVVNYLTKQIFIEKNIVTYRSLSRALSLHVNSAKNELEAYRIHATKSRQPCFATFLLSGEVSSSLDSEDVDMDNDASSNEDCDNDGELVPQTKITLVNERDLETAKSHYVRLSSIHVYSLSPSPIHDAGLLCAPTDIVRTVDDEQGAKITATVGRIVGVGIEMKGTRSSKGSKTSATPAAAGPSKLRKDTSAATDADKSNVVPASETTELKRQKSKSTMVPDAQKEKSKSGGMKDFFKSKPKEEVKKEEAPPKTGATKKLFFTNPPPPDAVPSAPASEEEKPKRGLKRKSTIPTPDTEDEETIPAAATSSRVRKGVIVSDDDELPKKPLRRISKAQPGISSAVDSDAVRNAVALMDIDDDRVERVSRSEEPAMEAQEAESDNMAVVEPEPDEDVSASDIPPKKPVKTRKTKPKKVIPVGRNGLKKKRIMKTRTKMDEKGYMATEDYSSYESVDEEEVVPVTRDKSKAAASNKGTETEDAASPAGPRKKSTATKGAKGSSSGKPGGVKGRQGSLANFFIAPQQKK